MAEAYIKLYIIENTLRSFIKETLEDSAGIAKPDLFGLEILSEEFLLEVQGMHKKEPCNRIIEEGFKQGIENSLAHQSCKE